MRDLPSRPAILFCSGRPSALLGSHSEGLSGLVLTDFVFQVDFNNGSHAQSARVRCGHHRLAWCTRSGLALTHGTWAWVACWQTRDTSPLCSLGLSFAFNWFITDFVSSPIFDLRERKMASMKDC